MLSFKTTHLIYEIYDENGALRQKSTLRECKLSLAIPLIGVISLI